jgi:transposase
LASAYTRPPPRSVGDYKSDQGGRRAARYLALIETANLNDIDPQAWLADVLARLPDHPANRIDQLLP